MLRCLAASARATRRPVTGPAGSATSDSSSAGQSSGGVSAMRLDGAAVARAVRRRLTRPAGWRVPLLTLALIWCVSRALVLFPGETLRDRTLYRVAILRDPGDVIIVRLVHRQTVRFTAYRASAHCQLLSISLPIKMASLHFAYFFANTSFHKVYDISLVKAVDVEQYISLSQKSFLPSISPLIVTR